AEERGVDAAAGETSEGVEERRHGRTSARALLELLAYPLELLGQLVGTPAEGEALGEGAQRQAGGGGILDVDEGFAEAVREAVERQALFPTSIAEEEREWPREHPGERRIQRGRARAHRGARHVRRNLAALEVEEHAVRTGEIKDRREGVGAVLERA